MSCYVVFKKMGGHFEFVAVYTNYELLMNEWEEKYGGGQYHWEPHPLNGTLDEALEM